MQYSITAATLPVSPCHPARHPRVISACLMDAGSSRISLPMHLSCCYCEATSGPNSHNNTQQRESCSGFIEEEEDRSWHHAFRCSASDMRKAHLWGCLRSRLKNDGCGVVLTLTIHLSVTSPHPFLLLYSLRLVFGSCAQSVGPPPAAEELSVKVDWHSYVTGTARLPSQCMAAHIADQSRRDPSAQLRDAATALFTTCTPQPWPCR
jgi:hypothetical protein